jgi:ATP/maltotriose-dependent transcriptional regulator MalT
VHALYGTHGFLCEVFRLRGDFTGALAHGRQAITLAGERGSPFSRVEAAVFFGAAALAAGDVAGATGALDSALELAHTRGTALWYEPRILATLAEAKRTGADHAGARALLEEARAAAALRRGWRPGAWDVSLAWVRLLASESVPNRPEIQAALDSLDAVAAELGGTLFPRAAQRERARLALAGPATSAR